VTVWAQPQRATRGPGGWLGHRWCRWELRRGCACARQGGLRLSGKHPGHLLAWARVSDGRWLALVRVTAEAGSHASLEMVQWVSSRAVRTVE